MRSPSCGTASRSHGSPKIPTSPSHGTSTSPASPRAIASASATLPSSASVTRQLHWRSGNANATSQDFTRG
jgi:hypothetical protein